MDRVSPGFPPRPTLAGLLVVVGQSGCAIDFDAPFSQTADGVRDATTDVSEEGAPDAEPDGETSADADASADVVNEDGPPPDAFDAACPISKKLCNGSCVDANDPDYGCEVPLDSAAPCAPCPSPPHATPQCVHETCDIDCEPGWMSCDTEPQTGCETNITTVTDCGSCGIVCPSAGGIPACVSGQCELHAPTWSFLWWRVDQPDNDCPEWGKITEVRFKVAGSFVVNAATSYGNGMVGGKALVQVTHSGDSLGYGPAWQAFDGTGEPWQKQSGGSYYWLGNEHLTVQVAEPIVAEAVQVGTFWGSVKCVRLSGSQDGVTWEVLGSACNVDCTSVVSFTP